MAKDKVCVRLEEELLYDLEEKYDTENQSETIRMDNMDLQKLLGIKRTRAYILEKEMETAGLIKIIGRGKERKYIAVNIS